MWSKIQLSRNSGRESSVILSRIRGIFSGIRHC
jgi:hypothetical protein